MTDKQLDATVETPTQDDAESVVFVSPDAEPVVEKLAGPSVDPTLRKQVETIVRDSLKAFMKGLGRKEPKPVESAFKTVGNQWFATWSNNFEDREGETFTAKAIDEYVARVDAGLVPKPELWFWHTGKEMRIGQADMVGRHGHFAVAMGTFDDTPKGTAARKYYAKHAKDTSLSHGFTYNPNSFKDGVYHDFNTFEISLLPRGVEANLFTTLQGVKDMAEKQLSKEKAEEISRVFGKEVLAELETSGKTLEEIDVVFKDFGHVEAEAPDAVVGDKATNRLIADLIGGQGELSSALLSAGKALKAEKTAREAAEAQYAKDLAAIRADVDNVLAELALKPRAASKDSATELTAERIAEITEAASKQATAKDSFWGTTVIKEGL